MDTSIFKYSFFILPATTNTCPSMKAYTETLSLLERNLEQLELQAPLDCDTAEKGIQLCRNTLQATRDRVLKKGFKSLHDECAFFKTIKPNLVGYLIFYINIIDIQMHRPMVSRKEKHNYYINYISTLGNYFLEHREIYQYHICNRTHLDREYFTRNSNSTSWYPDSLTSLIDTQFSTQKDMVIAQIIGNTRTIKYLRRKVSRNKKKSFGGAAKGPILKWTGNKVDLVELVYALQASNMINNGNIGIKELAKHIEELFSVQIGDYYRIFLEIRMRKNNQTKLLDLLKTCIQNKIMETDG